MLFQVEVQRYNKLFSAHDPKVPEAELLVVAAQHADRMYSRAFMKLARQVSRLFAAAFQCTCNLC